MVQGRGGVTSWGSLVIIDTRTERLLKLFVFFFGTQILFSDNSISYSSFSCFLLSWMWYCCLCFFVLVIFFSLPNANSLLCHLISWELLLQGQPTSGTSFILRRKTLHDTTDRRTAGWQRWILIRVRVCYPFFFPRKIFLYLL